MHTQDTEAREERDQQPPRAAHLHTPRPLPGCPDFMVFQAGARDLLTHPRLAGVSGEERVGEWRPGGGGTWEDVSSRCPAVEGLGWGSGLVSPSFQQNVSPFLPFPL